MAIVVASAGLTDEEFLREFRSGSLPLSCFRHGDHLRLAWIAVHRYPIEDALGYVRSGIRHYAERHGVGSIFHETMTAAWVRLLATHGETSFAEFLEGNEHRLTRELLHRFWSPAALDSEAARLRWVPPDRQALPDPTF